MAHSQQCCGQRLQANKQTADFYLLDSEQLLLFLLLFLEWAPALAYAKQQTANTKCECFYAAAE